MSFNSIHKLLILLAAVAVCSVNSLFAETEVSGEVSGVWDREGSPYIQVGNLRVSNGDTLIIEPGVVIILSENRVFNIFGTILAEGTEEDTVRFLNTEGILPNGISLLNDNEDICRFAYCRFDSMQGAITSDDCFLIIENCRFFECWKAVDLSRGWARIAECHSFSSDSARDGGQMDIGSHVEQGGAYEIIGNYMGGNNDTDIRINGADSAFVSENIGPEIYLYRVNRAIITNNNVETIYSRNCNASITISNNHTELIIVRDGGNHTISENITDELITEGTRYEAFNNDIGYIRSTDSHGTLQRNTIWEGIELGSWGLRSEVSLVNNTICCFLQIGDPDWEIIRGRGDITEFTNNIIFSRILRGYGTGNEINVNSGGYNCFSGCEEPYANRNLRQGDIEEYPIFTGGHPYEYQLQANSPCIDTGHPDSPNDPDGTRADIGCYYYDQENGMPPAIVSRYDVYTGWGMDFRYVARATDMEGEIAFEFEGLPEWLQVEDDGRRDFVADSAVVSGRVPEDQEDFVFVVTVRNGEEADTLSVRVMVYPYRVLTGIVRGVLDIEQSPFIVADTAWVPAGDSLVLPPGTELYFDNREDTLAGRSNAKLIISGYIKAIGIEEDSIYIGAFDPETDNFGFKFEDNPDGESEFRYCVFKGIRYRNRLLNANFTFTYTLSYEGFNNEFVAASSRGNLDFFENHGDVRFEFVGSGSIRDNSVRSMAVWSRDSTEIMDNRRISLSIYADNYVNVHSNSITDLTVNRFNREGVLNVEINDNILTGPTYEASFSSDNVNVEFTNNIIYNSVGGLKVNEGGFQTLISNNVIYNVGLGISQNYPDEDPDNLLMQNNIFHSIDTLLYVRRRGATGIQHNSISDFDFLSNDTTFDANRVQTNANGDSCDANFNIYLDPRLANPDSLDFRLYLDSPLINAGNPDSLFNDVDGSINDIGLSGGPYGQEPAYLDTNEVISFADTPGNFQVGQAYPNPFNSTSNISVEVPHNGTVAFSLFDIQGRRVANSSIQLTAGIHRRSLSEFLKIDTGGLRSGLYVLTIEYGGSRINRKLVLVK